MPPEEGSAGSLLLHSVRPEHLAGEGGDFKVFSLHSKDDPSQDFSPYLLRVSNNLLTGGALVPNLTFREMMSPTNKLKGETALRSTPELYHHGNIGQTLMGVRRSTRPSDVLFTSDGTSPISIVKRQPGSTLYGQRKQAIQRLMGIDVQRTEPVPESEMNLEPFKQLIEKVAWIGWNGSDKVDAHGSNIMVANDTSSPTGYRFGLIDIRKRPTDREFPMPTRQRIAISQISDTIKGLKCEYADHKHRIENPLAVQFWDVADAVEEEAIARVKAFSAQLEGKAIPEGVTPYDWGKYYEGKNKKPVFAKVDSVAATQMTSSQELLQMLRRIDAKSSQKMLG